MGAHSGPRQYGPVPRHPGPRLAHLLRRARELIEVALGMAARFPRQVKALLQDALALRDRRDAGEVSPHGVLVATGQLERRLDDVLSTHTSHSANERFRKHLAGHRDDLFTFLRLPNVEATSWPADHATRPAVLFRKVSGGHRSLAGAHPSDVLAVSASDHVRLGVKRSREGLTHDGVRRTSAAARAATRMSSVTPTRTAGRFDRAGRARGASCGGRGA